MTCPGIELANAKITLGEAGRPISTPNARPRAKALERSARDRRRAHDAVQRRSIDKADATATPLEGDALDQAVACGDYLEARDDGEGPTQANVDWSTEWKRRRANVSDGQLLFELNCARCHTAGLVGLRPDGSAAGAVNSVDILGLSGGGGGNGGGIGFNLRDGDVIRRFGTDVDGGFASQVDFVSNGSAPFKPYGIARPRLRQDARLRAGPDDGGAVSRRACSPTDQVKQIVVLRALLPRGHHVQGRHAGVRHLGRQRRRYRRRRPRPYRSRRRGDGGSSCTRSSPKAAPRDLWNPTIIGVLTVLCAVGLFCGSTYLLLGTNLGARLGFLVAAAGLSGFLVLLTTLWLTTPGSATGNSDLDPPHGNSASWKVVEVVADSRRLEDRRRCAICRPRAPRARPTSSPR